MLGKNLTMGTFIWFFVNTWKKNNWMWNQLKLMVLLLMPQLMIVAPILWCFVLLKCFQIHVKVYVNRTVMHSPVYLAYKIKKKKKNPIKILCKWIKGTIHQSYSNFKHYNNSSNLVSTILDSSNIMTSII